MIEEYIKEHWCKIADACVDGENVDFGRAVEVWTTKPHTVNRRLCAIKNVAEGSVSCHCGCKCACLVKHAVALYKTLQCQQLENSELCDIVQKCDNNESKKVGGAPGNNLKFFVRTLLPKRLDKFQPVKEVVLIDVCGWALFIPSRQESGDHYLTPPYLYGISWNNASKKIEIWVRRPTPSPEVSTLCQETTVVWLRTQLVPRLKKWAQAEPTNSGGSLRLVPVDRYNELYQELKLKHGPYLVENWPESTDPSKFVFEDIAIATYLLLIWEQERVDKQLQTKQSFLDLGCGNGLLVYILTQEGHPGAGLDIRKRKVWDLYGPDVQLKVASIKPSPETTYPEYNWLIGNHSDELTPWIPVMASRSTFTTNFFLLPCCAHDFDSKFQRVGSAVSQYRSYLDYVRQVAEVCGFQVEEDRLRIPSTKRICFVGMKRAHSEDDVNEVDKKMQDFILSRCKSGNVLNPLSIASVQIADSSDKPHQDTEHLDIFINSENDSNQSVHNMWAANFQPRSAVEPVRNCTRVNKDLVAKIVHIVANELLATEDNFIDIVTEDNSLVQWNRGRRVHLSSLVPLVEKDDLLQLKNECGGLQTLIKNHSHIFSVYQGTVGFRDYTLPEVKRKSRKVPSKPKSCWFHHHHPNGCPVLQSKCKFVH